jgi:hypothetical protein
MAWAQAGHWSDELLAAFGRGRGAELAAARRLAVVRRGGGGAPGRRRWQCGQCAGPRANSLWQLGQTLMIGPGSALCCG